MKHGVANMPAETPELRGQDPGGQRSANPGPAHTPINAPGAGGQLSRQARHGWSSLATGPAPTPEAPLGSAERARDAGRRVHDGGEARPRVGSSAPAPGRTDGSRRDAREPRQRHGGAGPSEARHTPADAWEPVEAVQAPRRRRPPGRSRAMVPADAWEPVPEAPAAPASPALPAAPPEPWLLGETPTPYTENQLDGAAARGPHGFGTSLGAEGMVDTHICKGANWPGAMAFSGIRTSRRPWSATFMRQGGLRAWPGGLSTTSGHLRWGAGIGTAAGGPPAARSRGAPSAAFARQASPCPLDPGLPGRGQRVGMSHDDAVNEAGGKMHGGQRHRIRRHGALVRLFGALRRTWSATHSCTCS